jgi:serine phosphatase RsbU (regulator of sigma subunit)
MGTPVSAAIRHSIDPIHAVTASDEALPRPDALPRRRVRERSLGLATALLVLLAAFAGDYLTGEQVSFSICYMIAIGVAAWFVGRRTGLVLAGLSAVAWLVSYVLVGHAFARPTILYWNIAVEAGIYLSTALAIARVREGVTREQALGAQVSRAYADLSREAESAGTLQRELLSQRLIEIAGYDSRVHYATSTRAGGDLYDFIPLAGGRVGIVIADASGHGVSAAVLMGMTLVLTRTESPAHTEPDDVLDLVNDHLHQTLPPESFVTACYAILDPGSGRLEYSLAGHDPPLIRRAASGLVEKLPPFGGAPLGLAPPLRRGRGYTVLAPGDTMILYTDGVTEAMSPREELFGGDRLIEALECPTSTLDDMLRSVLRAVTVHTGGAPLQDDVTLLLLRRRGAPREMAGVERGRDVGVPSLIAGGSI